jgi:hypothetical protein
MAPSTGHGRERAEHSGTNLRGLRVRQPLAEAAHLAFIKAGAKMRLPGEVGKGMVHRNRQAQCRRGDRTRYRQTHKKGKLPGTRDRASCAASACARRAAAHRHRQEGGSDEELRHRPRRSCAGLNARADSDCCKWKERLVASTCGSRSRAPVHGNGGYLQAEFSSSRFEASERTRGSHPNGIARQHTTQRTSETVASTKTIRHRTG